MIEEIKKSEEPCVGSDENAANSDAELMQDDPAGQLDSKADDPMENVATNRDNGVSDNGKALEDVLISLKTISETEAKTAIELHEIRKLYHNEFSSRLQSLQEELTRYREIEKGRVYDNILIDIARLYSENIAIVEKIEDERIKKQLKYLFLDMLQILETYGAVKYESKVGEKRNTKYCQVIERIATDNPELHDTIALSRSVGFYIENRALIKEMVDVFLYSKPINSNIDQDIKTEKSAENS